MKIGIIGLNGIGSYFVRSLNEALKKDIKGFDDINPYDIDLIDFDTIEEKNLTYTIYEVEHIGMKKVNVLAEIIGYKAVDKKVETFEDIKNYDFLILCVDNNKVRNIVYDSNIPFLDLRAKGKGILAYLTQKQLDDGEYKNLTIDDGTQASCQYDVDVEEKDIEFGNKIIAEIGLQIFKDYLKGEISQKKYILMV